MLYAPETPKGEPEAQEDPATESGGKEKKKRKDKETARAESRRDNGWTVGQQQWKFLGLNSFAF